MLVPINESFQFAFVVVLNLHLNKEGRGDYAVSILRGEIFKDSKERNTCQFWNALPLTIFNACTFFRILKIGPSLFFPFTFHAFLMLFSSTRLLTKNRKRMVFSYSIGKLKIRVHQLITAMEFAWRHRYYKKKRRRQSETWNGFRECGIDFFLIYSFFRLNYLWFFWLDVVRKMFKCWVKRLIPKGWNRFLIFPELCNCRSFPVLLERGWSISLC